METFLIALGVGVVLLILEYRTRWFAKRDSDHATQQSLKTLPEQASLKTQPDIETITPTPAGRVEYRETPDPKEIMNSYNDAAPFQRVSVGQSYIGIRVRWNVTFHTLHPLANDQFQVMMLNSGSSYPWIYCTIVIADYPELKVLRVGHKMQVSGEIYNVRGNEIFLKESTLRIL
jgi:hypothetical protein